MSPGFFHWGCVTTETYHFTYVYGPPAEWARLVQRLPAGACLSKGQHPTLDAARADAEAAAESLAAFYAGVGSARVASIAEFLAQWPQQAREQGPRRDSLAA